MQKISDSLEPVNTQAIGFSIPSDEEYYDDYEEDMSKTNPIGFRG